MKRAVVAAVVALGAFALLAPDLADASLAGWLRFPLRVLPKVRWSAGGIAVGVAAFVGVAVAVTVVTRTLRRPWRSRTAVAATAGVVVLFAAGIAMIGVTHQAVWLATSPERVFRPVVPANSRSLSQNNLHSLALGHLMFERDHRRDLLTTAGWGVRGLERWDEYAPAAGKYDIAQPWTDAANAKYVRRVVPEFINPGLPDAPQQDAAGYGLAHYAANGRAMRDGEFYPRYEFRRITNTVLIGEVNAAFRPWADPANVRDPNRGLNRSPHGFGGPPGRTAVQFAFADGSVRSVGVGVSPTVLRAISMPQSRDWVNLDALDPP